MITEPPFSFRLEAARQRIASANPPNLPQHEQDQANCAARDAKRAADVAAWLVPQLQPQRDWHQASTLFDGDRAVYLLAGLMGCVPCVHLRRGGPQPAFCILPLRRLDCSRCVSTVRKPPPDDSDRCDLCGTRHIDWFTPLVAQSGPVVFTGDVCPACTRALRLEELAA